MFDMMLGGAIGSAVSGLLGYQGQRETNSSNETMANNATAANMQEADRNRAFQSAEATTARNFEERMSNTAYQRAAKDMKEAGINPILMANSGASTPNASAPSGSQGSAVTSTNQNANVHLGGIFNSAMDAMKTLGEVDMQTAQKNLLIAQAKKTGVDTKVAEKDIPRSDLTNKIYNYFNKAIDRIKSKINDANSVNSAKQRDQMRSIKLKAN